MKEKKELEVIALPKTESAMVTQAKEVIINDSQSLKLAIDTRLRLSEIEDRLIADRDKILKPLKATVKEVNSRYAPALDTVEEALAITRKKIQTFQTEEKAREEAEADAIANRIGEGKGYLKPETASRKIEEIEIAPSKIGGITFITVKKCEVVDKTLLPMEYLVADEVAIRKAMKEGIELPGVRYFTVEQDRKS